MNTLLDQLKARDADTKHEVVALKEMKLDADDKSQSLVIGKDKYVLGNKGFEHLCNLVDVPKAYALRTPPDFRTQTFNYWLGLRGNNSAGVLLENDKVRSFVNPSYPYVSSFAIMDAVISQFPKDFQFGTPYMDDELVDVSVLSPELDQDLLDSPVKGGVRVVHSDSWNVFPRFDSYLWRQICTNGMVAQLGSRKFRVSGKSEKEIVSEVKDYAKLALEQIPDMLDGFLRTADQKVAKVSQLVQRICVENKIPKKISDIIVTTNESQEFKRTISNKQLGTMYHVVNLLTYVGTHNGYLSDAHREHLLAIAGNIVLKNTIRCDSCGGKVE